MAKYGRRSHECRKKIKRMQYGDETVNIENVVEMESLKIIPSLGWKAR